MNFKESWDIKTFTVEHISGVVPMADANACRQMLVDGGYKLTNSGAYTDHQIFPKVDSSRWQFHAERKKYELKEMRAHPSARR